jgi:3'-phosphoadenosine 5'-phosphosulfate sulfotransferase (PAPS reductase)/FAD synthetase
MAMKCEGVLATHRHALVSVSGGADSDAMVDVVERVRTERPTKVTYVWFDTGMEYQATKRHISDLESRYGIEILRERPDKTIPVSVREFGQPFMSKHVSEMCERLQRVGFQWEDEPYEVLRTRYYRCDSALRWWTNDYENRSRFNIGRNRWLKEWMIIHPPAFRISAKCCDYAKKRLSMRVERERETDVTLIGVRADEGGVRASHMRCFDKGSHGVDTYRPLFWLTTQQRDAYCARFGVTHSDCYRLWGMRRTGCVGCPFGRDVATEIRMVERHEPNVAKAARRIFADSYEYTRQFDDYRDFRRRGMRRLF